MDEDGDWSGMFWRFHPCSEEDVDVVLSRDTDSRLTQREKDAVDEEGNIDTQTLDYSKLVPVMVAAIKELSTKVETLETQISGSS